MEVPPITNGLNCSKANNSINNEALMKCKICDRYMAFFIPIEEGIEWRLLFLSNCWSCNA